MGGGDRHQKKSNTLHRIISTSSERASCAHSRALPARPRIYAHTHIPHSALTQRAPSCLAAPRGRRTSSRSAGLSPGTCLNRPQLRQRSFRRSAPALADRALAQVCPSTARHRHRSAERRSSLSKEPSARSRSGQAPRHTRQNGASTKQRPCMGCSFAAATPQPRGATHGAAAGGGGRQAPSRIEPRGHGQQGGALTPFLLAGLGASLRFSTMNPFLRPTARPVLSIVPGMLAARGRHELKKSSYATRPE